MSELFYVLALTESAVNEAKILSVYDDIDAAISEAREIADGGRKVIVFKSEPNLSSYVLSHHITRAVRSARTGKAYHRNVMVFGLKTFAVEYEDIESGNIDYVTITAESPEEARATFDAIYADWYKPIAIYERLVSFE